MGADGILFWWFQAIPLSESTTRNHGGNYRFGGPGKWHLVAGGGGAGAEGVQDGSFPNACGGEGSFIADAFVGPTAPS